jgi:CRP-like cAMP-binding protein
MDALTADEFHAAGVITSEERALVLVAALEARVAQLQRWLRMRVEERLADYLRGLAWDRGGELVVVQPPTSAGMGQVIAACREEVARVVASWERRGFITTRRSGDYGRGKIKGMTLKPALFAEMERLALLGRKA